MEVEEAVQSGVENVVSKMNSNLDYGLRWLDTWALDIDDLDKEFPIFKECLVQRRLNVFNILTIKRNKAKWESQTKKEMPATIDTVNHHVEKQIESGGQPRQEKLFNLSKNAKEDAPLTGFVEYFAYKLEERKYNLQYNITNNSGEPQKSHGKMKDIQPVIPNRAFF